jgi:putative phosphoribosyl transferase
MAKNKVNVVGQEIELAVETGGKITGLFETIEKPKGIIIFAHGSASNRFSHRNHYVAEFLQERGFATLLFDLLTESEEAVDSYTQEFRFNIDLLTKRLLLATGWCRKEKQTSRLPKGYFGASTGAAAALFAAAESGSEIKAVVSRGGRADLAIEKLPLVRAPALLIVGGNDTIVIDMNKRAARYLTVQNKLLVIPEAGHLFEEPGALEKAALAASEWFADYLMSEKTPDLPLPGRNP